MLNAFKNSITLFYNFVLKALRQIFDRQTTPLLSPSVEETPTPEPLYAIRVHPQLIRQNAFVGEFPNSRSSLSPRFFWKNHEENLSQEMRIYLESFKNTCPFLTYYAKAHLDLPLGEEKLCPLTLALMNIPVRIKGHTQAFNYSSLKRLTPNKDGLLTHPLTRKNFLPADIEPAIDIKNKIEDYLKPYKEKIDSKLRGKRKIPQMIFRTVRRSSRLNKNNKSIEGNLSQPGALTPGYRRRRI